jgi:hypothetical protein
MEETIDVQSLPLFLQLAHPCPTPVWKHVRRIKGKGSKQFLTTLSHHHLRSGKSSTTKYRRDNWGSMTDYKGYNYHRIVSYVAVSVWDNPEQRKKWLIHHKAISRLIG